MLEHMTAGCLESSSKRLLPGSRALKCRRRLQTTIWSQGSTSLKQLSRRGGNHKEDQGASRVLLDFLYPSNIQGFATHASKWRLPSSNKSIRVNRRPYSSLATGQDHGDLHSSQEYVSKSPAPRIPPEIALQEDLAPLLRLMGTSDRSSYDEAWLAFSHQDEEVQETLRMPIIQYLSTSERLSDADRLLQVIQFYKEDECTPEIDNARIWAHIKLQKYSKAVELHDKALHKWKRPINSASLLCHLLQTSRWKDALTVGTHTRHILRHGEYSGQKGLTQLYLLRPVLDLPNMLNVVSGLVNWFNDGMLQDVLRNKLSNAPLSLFEPAARQEKFEAPLEPPIDDSSQMLDKLNGTNAAAVLQVIDDFHEDRMTEATYYQNLAVTLVVNALIKAPPDGDYQKLRDLRDFLLKNSKLPLPVWENIIATFLHSRQNLLAIDSYRFHRSRSKYKDTFGGFILVRLLDIFCRSHDVTGMNQVVEDLTSRYGKPSRTVYRMCMTEFASRGDIKALEATFEKFKGSYGPDVVTANSLSCFLHAYTIRGERDKATEMFHSMEEKYGFKPNLLCWTILINAHCQVDDLEQAWQCYQDMLSAGLKPDQYTIGTLMGCCAAQKDLDGVLFLLEHLSSFDMEPNNVMVECLVLSYLQNDMYAEAEKACLDMAEKVPKESTRMWNYLLKYRANRRDIGGVYELLKQMHTLVVPYDSVTFGILMHGLCMVSQPDRAFPILNKVMPSAGFTPTTYHFVVLMGGYLHTGQFRRFWKTYGLMKRQETPETSSSKLIRLRQALQSDERRWQKFIREEKASPSAESDLTSNAPNQLRIARAAFTKIILSAAPEDHVDPLRYGLRRAPASIGYYLPYYELLIYACGKRGDLKQVLHYVDKFNKMSGGMDTAKLPQSIMPGLMEAQYQAGNYTEVCELWRISFRQAMNRYKKTGSMLLGKRNKDSKVPYTYGRALCLQLTPYLKVLAEQNRVSDAVRTVDELEEAGFVLDRENRNIYVRLLAQDKRFREAFEICEDHLMPGFTGWEKGRYKQEPRLKTPHEYRREARSRFFIRPAVETLKVLSEVYYQLRDWSVESVVAERAFEFIELHCTKTVGAILSMPRTWQEAKK